jgi:hypothetical protein
VVVLNMVFTMLAALAKKNFSEEVS